MASSTANEWDLIKGSVSTSARPSLAASLVDADFKSVLLSDDAKRVFQSSPELFKGLASISKPTGDEASAQLPDSSTRLVIAIALLHSYIQLNWTGPDLDFTSLDLLPSGTSPQPTLDELNTASIPFLTLQGEPAYHLSHQPTFLLLSLRLFNSLSSDQLDTLGWWKLRLHLVHQALLDEPVSMDPLVLAELNELKDRLREDEADTRASLHVEIGLLHHSLGQDKAANREFLQAAQASGLEFELTGAMGKKTKWQQEALSQLVLLAESRKREGEEEETKKTEKDAPDNTASTVPENLQLNDDTLLEETEFTKMTSADPTASGSRLSHLDPSDQPALYPLDQALLLSFCLSQHNSLPSSGLTASQMSPFLSRVLTHPRNWSIHTTALLLRSRLESGRSRTVERSTLQLSALIEQMPTSDSSTPERLKYVHQLPLPSRWEMERELAKRYLSLGVVRSALEIFVRLEMWQDVVGCYQRMEEEDKAERVVRDLLEGKKIEADSVSVDFKVRVEKKQKLEAGREGKLWCLLGDIRLASDEFSQDPSGTLPKVVELYEKAWTTSKGTSSRAMRSLGSLYVSARQYEKGIECLKKALDINPLFGRSWFTLGVCYVKLEKWSEAKETFKREVAIEEEDGEGWNNLAAVYLRLGEEGMTPGQTAPAVSFENKILAHRALKQGLRFSYESWRMWQNYMVVSIDVGELSEAARAMGRVVEELSTRNPDIAVDYEVLDKLVDSVTRDNWDDRANVQPTSSNEGFGLWPILERLFDVTILPRVSDSVRVWKSHARLLRWKHDWAGAMDDYLKAYRVGIVADERVEREVERWREAVEEIKELVDTLQALGGMGSSGAAEEGEGKAKKKGDWRFQARGIVRTFIGRTRDAFGDEPEMDELKELLEELKTQ
ncbi:tetratricopeptide repeat protein 27, partial [Tremellales sp. Uapishka_1]